jgi:hypothetical protein
MNIIKSYPIKMIIQKFSMKYCFVKNVKQKIFKKIVNFVLLI